MIIDVMQHNAEFGLSSISQWAEERDIELRVHRLDQDEDIRALNPADMDGLVLLGGFASVNDEETWLAAERIFIRSLDKLGRPVFGIGLGAEQIVRAFGSPVFAGKAEIGFGKVKSIEDDTEFTALHCHDEYMSELPGATTLFTNAQTQNQGFRYHAHIMGVQFHLEVQPDEVQAVAAERGVQVNDSGVDYESMHERLAGMLTSTFLA
ncbi:type 1 glutamine amidotransferase [Lacticaseibacillus hulanensis]|uniref:type 1 glutamine amidotransferase n=1 Tax=Lacticaseibacillus hulanensis TaxID=2493111 RepID=UPI000FDCAE95|nr:type 1 glutamine amidotransferase [Lacticaseibacillus hulanensis]